MVTSCALGAIRKSPESLYVSAFTVLLSLRLHCSNTAEVYCGGCVVPEWRDALACHAIDDLCVGYRLIVIGLGISRVASGVVERDESPAPLRSTASPTIRAGCWRRAAGGVRRPPHRVLCPMVSLSGSSFQLTGFCGCCRTSNGSLIFRCVRGKLRPAADRRVGIVAGAGRFVADVANQPQQRVIQFIVGGISLRQIGIVRARRAGVDDVRHRHRPCCLD